MNACDIHDEDGDDGADMMAMMTMIMVTIFMIMTIYCYNYSDSISTFESAALSKRCYN